MSFHSLSHWYILIFKVLFIWSAPVLLTSNNQKIVGITFIDFSGFIGDDIYIFWLLLYFIFIVFILEYLTCVFFSVCYQFFATLLLYFLPRKLTHL